EMIARAKRRLEALGYFSSVNITTAPGSAADRVVVIVDVQDQSTGSFGIGAGYAAGSGGGFLVEASIEEKNFLGRGQYIRVAAGKGEDSQTYNVSFTEPYFLGYRLAAGFDVFKNEYDFDEDNYSYNDQGFSLRVTAPITENLSTTLRYNYTELEYFGDEDELSSPYVRAIEESPWTRSSVSQSITYNTLDDAQLPHEGLLASVTQEFAGLGGTSDFYKLTGKARWYYTLNDEADLIGSLAGTAGHLFKTSGSMEVFDQFQLGSNDIRGFERNGIGPRANNGDALGGTTYFTASAEASFPLPGIPRDSGFRGAFFVDAGTLYGNDVELTGADEFARGTDSSLRASVGVSLIWASPFGPLRVDYAVPVAKEDFDKVQNFKFGINSSF
ncbi:MAG TPA: outer membrane protein assembly factor BamA, partial [Sinorhizobium sp.]|nr:outer membrane protein assembly factor BamA [Sinorhizobium sp.]